MKERIVTGFLLALILIPLLFLPPIFFYIAVGIMIIIASYEMFEMTQVRYPLPEMFVVFQGIGALGLYSLTLGVYLNMIMAESLLWWLLALTLAGLVLIVFSKKYRSGHLGRAFVSIFYVGLAFSALSMVRHLGLTSLVYMLILAMGTDVFAYFFGIKFGKHRLAPTISPKKSIEGAVSGTVIAVALATTFALFFDVFPIEHTLLKILTIIVTGVFVSVIAQIGDLVASSIKREYDIKDFSNLLPGHGGILDRFDSSTFAALALMIVMILIEVF